MSDRVNEVKGIMEDNISVLLDNTARVEHLEGQSVALMESASVFKRATNRVKRHYLMQNAKFGALAGTAVTAVTAAVTVPPLAAAAGSGWESAWTGHCGYGWVGDWRRYHLLAQQKDRRDVLPMTRHPRTKSRAWWWWRRRWCRFEMRELNSEKGEAACVLGAASERRAYCELETASRNGSLSRPVHSGTARPGLHVI